MYLTTLNFEYDHKRLVDDFYDLIKPNIKDDQISLQRRSNTPVNKQLTESCKSILYDWDAFNPDTMEWPPLRTDKLKEEDFNITVDLIKGSYLGEVMDQLWIEYGVFRTRIMGMKPRSCLTWHKDYTKRLHIPIITNDDCFMVIEDSKVHIPSHKAHIVDTTVPHTALNASVEYRWHLVACLEE